jgi:hypothetical protein
VFRDRAETAVAGKDTARYWDAGAADVRWVVGARGQEHEGLERALGELAGHPGVLVEGNRIVTRLSPDLAILVARPGQKEIKASARRIVGRMDALFVPEDGADDPGALVGAPGGWVKTVWGPSDLDGIAAALRARG